MTRFDGSSWGIDGYLPDSRSDGQLKQEPHIVRYFQTRFSRTVWLPFLERIWMYVHTVRVTIRMKSNPLNNNNINKNILSLAVLSF